MPFTPFHFGPHACIGLPFHRKLDLPLFIGANVMIDMEPLAVLWLDLRYPLHGYLHTLLFGAMAGVVFALLVFPFRNFIQRCMALIRLDYNPSLKWMLFSAVSGAWLHVLLDSFLYPDIRPFYPLSVNPLLYRLSEMQVYVGCLLSFIPAGIYYFGSILSGQEKFSNNSLSLKGSFILSERGSKSSPKEHFRNGLIGRIRRTL